MAGQFACTRSPTACCTNTSRPGTVSAASNDQAGSRPAARRTATHTPAESRMNTKGVARPTCPPSSSDKWRSAAPGSQSPVRPPCLAKLAQPCSAFHSTTGANTAAAAAPPSQRKALRNHRRSPGTHRSHSTMPKPRKPPVYLLAAAHPADTPTASHHHPSPDRSSRASAHIVAAQNSSSGVSGVIVTAPAPTSSVPFSNAAAGKPSRRPGNSSSAVCATSTEPATADNGANSRTPSAPSPAMKVPARIHSATIGGWSR